MDFLILHQCFHENHTTLNPGKCHYMVIGSSDTSIEIMLNSNNITSSNEEKLLGIFLDCKLRRFFLPQLKHCEFRYENYLL